MDVKNNKDIRNNKKLILNRDTERNVFRKNFERNCFYQQLLHEALVLRRIKTLTTAGSTAHYLPTRHGSPYWIHYRISLLNPYCGGGPSVTWAKSSGLIHFANASFTCSAVRSR